ncbi:MAG: PH domain-containing protein [Pseudolabrys sp.]
MRYIERILQPGEKVLYYGRLHWIIYLPAAIILLPMIGSLFMSANARSGSPAELSWLIAAVVFALAAAVMLFSAWFRRWTTEIDVTDRRVVYKRGFIKRHTVEMNMDKVASVDVDQSIFGRLLNFGDITIHGTGDSEVIERLHNIGAPLEFRNQVTAR